MEREEGMGRVLSEKVKYEFRYSSVRPTCWNPLQGGRETLQATLSPI